MHDPYQRSVSIDPGKHVSGWALWLGEHLLGCGIHRHGEDLPALITEFSPVERVYLETMEIRGSRSGGKEADLLHVATRGSYFAGRIRPRHLVEFTPSGWKAQVPKDIHHDRVRFALDRPREEEVLRTGLLPVPAGNRKEVLDAIGIGLYGLGRTKRGGVVRR